MAEQAILGRNGERAARETLRSRAATSQHLKVLREVGPAVPARQGNIVRYSLSQNVSAQVLADIGRAFERLDDDNGIGAGAASG